MSREQRSVVVPPASLERFAVNNGSTPSEAQSMHRHSSIHRAAFRRSRCASEKPKFHGSSFLVADVMRMSLTCREKIWRVGRVYATRMLATCPQQVVLTKSCSWNLENETTHGRTGSSSLYILCSDHRPTNQVSAWRAERASRPTSS